MPLTKYDLDHMDDIMRGHGTWFSAMLMRLIDKADFENTEKLRAVYPEHVMIYERWLRGEQLFT